MANDIQHVFCLEIEGTWQTTFSMCSVWKLKERGKRHSTRVLSGNLRNVANDIQHVFCLETEGKWQTKRHSTTRALS